MTQPGETAEQQSLATPGNGRARVQPAEQTDVGERSRARAAARRRRELALEWSVRFVSLAILLGIWEVYGRSVNRALFAPPSAVLVAGFDMIRSGELWRYLQGSLIVLGYGFTIALVIGIPLGVALARSRIVAYALDWYIAA